ncbi:dus, partial [Symbiodinium sp. CCMP2456]
LWTRVEPGLAPFGDMTSVEWLMPTQLQVESLGPASAMGLKVPATFRPPPGLEVESPTTSSVVEGDISIPWFGSRGHPLACSRPCVYMKKSGGCTAGAACTFCHFNHTGTSMKPDKLQRRLLNEMAEQDRLAAFLPYIKDRVVAEIDHPLADLIVVLLEAELANLPVPTDTRRRSKLKK